LHNKKKKLEEIDCVFFVDRQRPLTCNYQLGSPGCFIAVRFV